MTEYQLSSLTQLHKILNLSDRTDIRTLAPYFAIFDTCNNLEASSRHGKRIANALFESGIKTIGEFRTTSSSKIAVTKFDGRLQKITVEARLYFPQFLLIDSTKSEEKRNAYLLNDFDDIEILASIFPCMATIIDKIKFKLNVQTIGQFLCIKKDEIINFSEEDKMTILKTQDKIDVR